jgi:hypothetical protein
MQIGLIKLGYRQLIDARCTTAFEKNVFEDSYSELLMQVQRYNPDNRFTTFQEIIAHDPKANSLHYKVGFAIGLYMHTLNKQIPGLWDTRHKVTVPFAMHELEIVQSDITDKKQHVVAINYTSEPVALLGNAGNNLILSFDDPKQGWMETFLLPLQPALTVAAYRPVPAIQTELQDTVFAG